MDAAANNLGKVSLKTIEDVKQSTIELLSVYNRKYTDEQYIAIDDFLETLAPIKDKIKVLVLPFLFADSDETPIAFGTNTLAMYDIIRKEKTSINAAIANSAKFCIKNGGIVLSGDAQPTTGLYLQNAWIPSDLKEYCVGVNGKTVSMWNYRFETEAYKIGIKTSAGISLPTGFLAEMPEIKGINTLLMRWSDTDNILEGIVDGDVKVSRVSSDLEKPSSIDESNAIYPTNKYYDTEPTRMIMQAYGLSTAEAIKFSKAINTLITSFGY